MAEQWLPVIDYEGLYEVSDRGRVRRSASGRGTWRGRILMPQRHPRGYRIVSLSRDGIERSFLVHRLVAAAFIGPAPQGQAPNHRDGNKANNARANLEYVTPSANVQHALAMALIPYGERSHQHRLSAEQVLAIRRDAGKVSQAKLSEQYGVSRGAIAGVIYGKNWKQLTSGASRG